jgi:hypothetical protein
MAFLLSNLLQKAYEKLGQANYSLATGGSVATIVDSRQAGLHGDDAWKEGATFVTRDAAGALPENQFALVTGYTDSTGTFTSAAAAFTTAPAATDTYMFVNDFYPLYTMIELANSALQSLGPIPLIDTSITSAASQTEYTLPVACKRQKPLRVDYQGKTGDANDNQWIAIDNWRYEPATAGTTAVLVLPQLVTGRTVRIWYMGVHPTLTTYSSVVVETIEPELATALLVEKALEWQNSRLQGGDDFLVQRWNDQKQQVLAARAQFPISKPKRRPRLMIVGGHVAEDEFTHP